MIGMGIRLDRMPDIRRLFGVDPGGIAAIGTASRLRQKQLLHAVSYDHQGRFGPQFSVSNQGCPLFPVMCK